MARLSLHPRRKERVFIPERGPPRALGTPPMRSEASAVNCPGDVTVRLELSSTAIQACLLRLASLKLLDHTLLRTQHCGSIGWCLRSLNCRFDLVHLHRELDGVGGSLRAQVVHARLQ